MSRTSIATAPTTSLRRSAARFATATVIAVALALSLLPGAAFAATLTPIDSMRVLSQQMGDGALVQILASVKAGATLPTETEILVPKEFTFGSAQLFRSEQFSDESAAEPTGEATYRTEARGDDIAYIITLEGADSVMLIFTAPAGIFSVPTDGHATAQLGLVAPADLATLEYGFVMPAGTTGVGDNVVQFGTTSDGAAISGVAFTDVKKGERKTAQLAIGESTGSTDNTAGSTGGPSWISQYLSGTNLIIAILVVVVVALVAVAAVVLVRRRNSYEEWDLEDEGADDEGVADAGAGSGATDAAEDDEDFFRD